MKKQMKKPSIQIRDYRFKLSPIAVACATTLSGLLVLSSVAQASDMQIYASPTAGQKTIVMMLDTSGSMGYGAGYNNGNSTGFAIYDDYGGVCSGLNTITSGTSYSNGKLYSVKAGTTPDYDRNFCYVSKANANTAVTNTITGCEVQPLGATGTSITGYRCYDRLTRLKDGMFALLNSSDTDAKKFVTGTDAQASLSETFVGVGNFSANGDGKTAQILVPSKKLGDVGSTQRTALKTAIAGLTANNGTPSAHAYAEAASYLMGTTTYSEQNYNIKRYTRYLSRSYTTSYNAFNRTYTYTYTYYVQTCRTSSSVNLDTSIQTCSRWNSATQTTGTSTGSTSNNPVWTNQPVIQPTGGWLDSANANEFYAGDYYTYTVVNGDSGTPTSKLNDTSSNPDIVINRAATDADAQYKSPLPANQASCDGQGVYFLSDGAANASSNDRAAALMQKSLGSLAFQCSTDLPNQNDSNSAWNCMGAYAKSLFNPSNNPKGRSIQTAFVGFGSTFFTSNIEQTSSVDTQNACRMSSRAYNDPLTGAAPNDKCSPGYGGSLAVSSPTANTSGTARSDGYNYDGGYGNGGFFQASTSDDVTKSVVQFINSLGATPPDPLSTGAISVPVDALNPNGFQPYGYLRALKPQPGKNYLIWQGNLKKYNIIDGALKDGGKTVFTALGALNKDTKDLWNASALSDQGLIEKGGVYEKLRLPTVTSPSTFRTVVTDIASVNNGAIVKTSTPNSSLLTISSQDSTTSSTTLLDDFKNKNILKDLSLSLKVRLLNYLGYDLDLATTTTLPATLTPPKDPFVSMGASIHSYPVQLTYSGDLDANGDLTDTRQQSVLYASMEGGLRIVDAQTGAEQMVFLPADILNKDASRALRRSEPGSLTYGVDGAWVADSAYKFSSTSSTSSVVAKQMNVYGGMRMGGESYYGLDVLTPKSPKFLFRVGSDLADYSRMGQTWSKPVLANIRYNNKITRVMIVGGGYDACYENPQFRLGNANPTEYGGGCNKTEAQGNAIYIIDAQTGKRLWWASSSGANINNSNMKHSIVSRISTLDRDADGLVDHLYVGDLGGQVFRVDLNNAKDTPTSNLALRVVRLANLGSDTIASGNQPRFYQPPTITIHDSGTNTFILVGIASGDRSTPLDVSPTVGREGMLPSAALTGRPTNKVFGLIDRDFINKKLNMASAGVNQVVDGDLKTKDIPFSSLQQNPQNLSGDIATVFFGGGKEGWYRSLSSDYTGSEVSGRTAGGIKAFEEEPMAITNYLYVPVYDPQGTGVEAQDPCKPRIIGETDIQQFCLPFGVCLDSDGKKNSTAEAETGFQISGGKNLNVVGIGIRGITLGPKPPSGGSNPSTNSCGSLTLIGNTQGKGTWECKRLLNPIRWYERYVTAQTK